MRSRFVGGFTLIEVLVAVFVLAIGIIGAVATQMAALRTRQGSSLMSNGVQLASALAERMRANVAHMQASDDANAYLQLRYDAEADGAPEPATPLCYATENCSSAHMAAFDLFEVKQALHRHFPGGRVLVCRDAQVWDARGGALTWNCTGGATAAIVIKIGWRSGDSAADSGVLDKARPMVVIALAGAAA